MKIPDRIYAYVAESRGRHALAKWGYTPKDGAVEYVRADLTRQWRPASTIPTDGRRVLAYRPLAHVTNDPVIKIVRAIGGNNSCWSETVPAGQAPCNPTDGYCHVTHWMPLPPEPGVSK